MAMCDPAENVASCSREEGQRYRPEEAVLDHPPLFWAPHLRRTPRGDDDIPADAREAAPGSQPHLEEGAETVRRSAQ